MKRIFLVRHTEVANTSARRYYGSTDVELSPRGKQQAQLLADYLSLQGIKAVFSSNLKRAKCPANLLARKLKLEHGIEPGLQELNFGSWEGLSFEEMLKRNPQLYQDWMRMSPELCFPEGESLAQFHQRVIPAFKKIVACPDIDSPVAVFTHGGVIKLILADLMGVPWGQVNCLRQSFGAVNIIDYQDGYGILQLMNDTCYLEDCHG